VDVCGVVTQAKQEIGPNLTSMFQTKYLNRIEIHDKIGTKKIYSKKVYLHPRFPVRENEPKRRNSYIKDENATVTTSVLSPQLPKSRVTKRYESFLAPSHRYTRLSRHHSCSMMGPSIDTYISPQHIHTMPSFNS
jgi:hypothetical protein